MILNTEFTLGFAGDFCLGAASYRGLEYVHDVLKFCNSLNISVDWSMANFEFCIKPDHVPSHSRMGVPESLCRELDSAGFSAFCLANNHVKDYGDNALLQTIERLDQLNLRHVGAGATEADAESVLQIDLKGLKLGVLAATDATHYAAGSFRPGVAALKKRSLIHRVALAAEQYDLVVNIHADLEFTKLPSTLACSTFT